MKIRMRSIKEIDLAGDLSDCNLKFVCIWNNRVPIDDERPRLQQEKLPMLVNCKFDV